MAAWLLPEGRVAQDLWRRAEVIRNRERSDDALPRLSTHGAGRFSPQRGDSSATLFIHE
jgi:hypothetical protein